MRMAFDFETFYSKELSVKDLGAREYAKRLNPSTDIYWLTVAAEDGYRWGGHPVGMPEEVRRRFDDETVELCAHNARFDLELLERLAEGRIIERSDWWSRTDCTADMASFFGLPRALDRLALELTGTKPDKTIRAMMLGRRFGDLPENKREALQKYAMIDSELCLEFCQRLLPKWPEKERALSKSTRNMCRRGVPVDEEYARKQLDKAKTALAEYERALPWVHEGRPPSSPYAVADECVRLGIPKPETTVADDERWKDWLENHGSQAPWATALNKWRSANRVVKWLEKVIQRTENGRMPYGMLYCAATTGRFGGADGVNLVNMSRDGVEGADLRGCIHDPEGDLVVVDLAQIEARIAYWMMGEHELLDKVAEGMSIYEAYARERGLWTSEEPLKKGNPHLYGQIKARCLALNYGMSYLRFANTMASWGVPIGKDEAMETVYEYRASLPSLEKLWSRMDLTLRTMIGKKTATLNLASGRKLYFHRTSFDDNGDIVCVRHRSKPLPEKMYGAKLLENVCQALGRDLLVNALEWAEAAGMEVVLHVHDELVIRAPKGEGEETLRKFLEFPKPEWAEDLPVDWEGEVLSRYRK